MKIPTLADPCITQWKAIAEFINVKTKRTAKIYHQKYGLPVRFFPGRTPVLMAFEAYCWQMKLEGNRLESCLSLEAPWVTQWQNISDFLGLKSIKTAKKYHQKYSMPVRFLPGGTPVLIPVEVYFWLVEYDKLRRKAFKKQDYKDKKPWVLPLDEYYLHTKWDAGQTLEGMILHEPYVRGWGNIAAYLGFESINSVKRYVVDFSLPVRDSIGTKPVMMPIEAYYWLVKFDDLKKEDTNNKKLQNNFK